MIQIFEKIITSENQIYDLIIKSLNEKNNVLISYINQHTFNIYYSDKNFRKLLNDKFILFSDGIGIYYGLKFLGEKNINRFNGSDLNYICFNYFIENKTKIFIIGGKFNIDFILNKAKEKKLNLVGYQNGYFKEEYIDTIINEINIQKPDVILVGMGVPKQEFFSNKISEKINCSTIICVGNFLEFYFGTIDRAPKFLQNIGFEWLHRLIVEPKRLWKRYIIGIPLFINRIIFLKIKGYLVNEIKK
ncbi:MAG: WecB/TagA/CpsF family glycosyltransferase [Ignavibacterium sp.]